MIAHQLGMQIATLIIKTVGRSRISFEKVYDALAQHLLKINTFGELRTFSPDKRHITRDKRNWKSPVESGITALT